MSLKFLLNKGPELISNPQNRAVQFYSFIQNLWSFSSELQNLPKLPMWYIMYTQNLQFLNLLNFMEWAPVNFISIHSHGLHSVEKL